MIDVTRRRVATGVLAFGMLAALAACSSSPSDSTSESSSSASEGESESEDSGGGSGDATTVTVWHGFTEADGQVVQALAEEFNASQDDYEIVMEVNPWNVITDKLLPAVSAGNGPDLVVQGVDAGQGYVNQGVFVSMQSFYDNAENETDTYYQHVVDYANFDGENYAVPMAYGPFSVWFNTQMFADAGITEADYPTTWEEWVALSEQLTVDENGDGTPEIYGLSMATGDGTFLPTALQAGGGDVYQDGEVVLDTPENIAVMEFWREAYAGGSMPNNVTLPEAVDLFKAGKAAMTVIGPWIITGADSVGLEIGVFEVPAGPERVASQAAANYWWLTSQAGEPETAGAEAFLRYYNSRESQVRWALESFYPPNRTDIEASDLAESEYVARMMDYTENAYIRLYGIPGGLNDVNATLTQLSLDVTQGTGDIATLTTDAATEISGIVSKFQ